MNPEGVVGLTEFESQLEHSSTELLAVSDVADHTGRSKKGVLRFGIHTQYFLNTFLRCSVPKWS
jgi:hypothetical protein